MEAEAEAVDSCHSDHFGISMDCQIDVEMGTTVHRPFVAAILAGDWIFWDWRCLAYSPSYYCHLTHRMVNGN
jgi:hypothetical protein